MEITKLLENKDYKSIKIQLNQLFVQDIAIILDSLDETSLLKVFRLLSKDNAAIVFSYISNDSREKITNAISDNELKNIINEMYLDDIVDFVEEMPANVVEKILRTASSENRKNINTYLRYLDNSAGSIMTNEFIDLKKENTVSIALAKIRKYGIDAETINILFVTDEKRVLMGYMSIKDLLLAKPEEKLGDIMRENVIYAFTDSDQEQIAKTFKKYNIIVLPIVDKEKRLVGIVTIDDIVDVILNEATEDIQKMNALTPSDKPYLKTSVGRIWWQRIPWLLLLMVSATFTGLIITSNQAILSSSAYGIILTACIPMLMDTGGNCGCQASATIIRGIALDEIKFKDIFRVIWKEIRVALLLGITLAFTCALKLLFIDGLVRVENGLMVTVIVCFAMLFTVLLAKFIGCALPLLAKKIHLDPAVMATPLITTIVDALSLMVLCKIAIIFLPM